MQGSSRTGLHGRDASCTIDEHSTSVSVTGAGLYFRPGDIGRAGRGAMNRALSLNDGYRPDLILPVRELARQPALSAA